LTVAPVRGPTVAPVRGPTVAPVRGPTVAPVRGPTGLDGSFFRRVRSNSRRTPFASDRLLRPSTSSRDESASARVEMLNRERFLPALRATPSPLSRLARANRLAARAILQTRPLAHLVRTNA